MAIHDTRIDFLDDLLQRISIKLQLSPTQYSQAEDHYNAVSSWLADAEGLLSDADVQMYPQGSFRIGTTVKPIAKEEFDLDFVCELNVHFSTLQPDYLLDLVEQRLKEHETYNKMMTRKNRCIRLEYAKEFHMDIVPACQGDNLVQDAVMIPDGKAGWRSTNPIGYAKWFNGIAESSQTLLAKAEAEPLPDPQPIGKPPLKSAVQLIKRYQDVALREEPKIKTASIVITTLAGLNYRTEATIGETMGGLLQRIAELILDQGDSPPQVMNPSNPGEDLSERWREDPRVFKRFAKLILDLTTDWVELQGVEGIHNVANKLAEMFGESVTQETIAEFVKSNVNDLRESDRLAIQRGSGILTTGSDNTTGVQKNTFYGSD